MRSTSHQSTRTLGARRGAGHPDYAAGIGASIAAETVFVPIVMMLARLQEKDPWRVTRAPASLVMGPDANRPPGFVPADVARGLTMHAVLSVLVGWIYAALLPRLRLGPIAGGLITGGVLYALGSYILPGAFPRWLSPMKKSARERVGAAATHALYGVAFGLFYRAFGGSNPSASLDSHRRYARRRSTSTQTERS